MLGCFIIKYILESRDRKLMKARDNKKFRHKGYKNNCIKTIMGEVEYKRAVYLFEEDGEKKYVYLLDEDMKIETIGKVSVNLAEKALAVAVNTTSYRKGAEEITNTTNETISHEGLRDIVLKVGEEIITIDNSNNGGDVLSDVDENNQSENANDENGQIDNKNSKTTKLFKYRFKLPQN